MKNCLIAVLLLVFSSSAAHATANYSIATRSTDFFENVVSDTLLLLDQELRSSLQPELETIISHARFTQERNAWTPRTNHRAQLATIHGNTTATTLKESFAALIRPVVELACVSSEYDPMNSIAARCVKETLSYPVTDTLRINYRYAAPKGVDQYIAGLAGLNSANRYQQIVRTTADLLNSAYQTAHNRPVTVQAQLVKQPMSYIVTGKGTSRSSGSSGTAPRRSCSR